MASLENNVSQAEAYSRDTTRGRALIEHKRDAGPSKGLLEFFEAAFRGQHFVHGLLNPQAGGRLFGALKTAHLTGRGLTPVRRRCGGFGQMGATIGREPVLGLKGPDDHLRP